jgi:predicted nucleic acid-binding protein
MIVVDASVAVKWFVPEAGTAEADALLQSDMPRAAPEHLLAEVGQALLRQHREQQLPLEFCRAALADLPEVVTLFPTEALAREAFDIAAEGGCSVYDALYVAAAERWDCVVLTADAKLVAKLDASPWRSRLQLLAAKPSRA